MKRFLNRQSFAKMSFRSIQFSIVALIMLLGLNLGTMKSATAAPTSVVKSAPVAIFGLGRQAEGKVDQAVGKAGVIDIGIACHKHHIHSVPPAAAHFVASHRQRRPRQTIQNEGKRHG